MAYNPDQFCHSGGTSRAPRYHTYHTSDSKSNVSSAGYFNREHVRLRVNDIITIVNTDDVYDAIVSSVSTNLVVIELAALLQIGFTEYSLDPLAIPVTVAINSDGVTYTQVPSFVASPANRFTVVSDDLKYTGVGGNFMFNLSSNVESNKVAEITYSLFKNGVIISDEQVSISFTSANKKLTISSSGIISLATNDLISIRLRGDGTSGHEAMINKLDLTVVGL